MKKLFAFVLVALMSLVPTTMCAQSAIIDGILYNLHEDGTASVAHQESKASGDIVIPSQITVDQKDYTVTALEELCFSSCSSLTSVVLPESVTSIDRYAFTCCYDLKCVNIPSGVKILNEETFSSCEGLTSITLPEGLTSIGRCCFWYCTNLTSIEIPASVTEIGDDAFCNCYSLESVILHEGLENLGDNCFTNCESLTSIDFPATIKQSPFAFTCCTSLKSINFHDGLTSIGSACFAACESLASLEIPASVTEIEGAAFAYCEAIKSVTCHAITPPTCGIYIPEKIEDDEYLLVWSEVPQSEIPLYVPAESVELYRNADQWKEFNIMANPSTAVSDVNVAGVDKARKSIVDGQLVIEKDGVKYNVTGQAIK